MPRIRILLIEAVEALQIQLAIFQRPKDGDPHRQQICVVLPTLFVQSFPTPG